MSVVGLAGCSSSGGSPSPSSSSTHTPGPAPTTSTVTVVRPAPTTSNGTAASNHVSATTTTATATSTVTRCPASSLKLGRRPGAGAGGTEYLTVELTNTSRSTCTLYGYPGVSIVNSSGNTVQHPAKWGQTGTESVPGPKTVTLAPGRTGYFLLTSINVIPNPDCSQAFHGSRLRVYPPGSVKSITITLTQPFCDLGVGPVTGKPN